MKRAFLSVAALLASLSGGTAWASACCSPGYNCCPVSSCQPTACYTACRVERETCYRTVYETVCEPQQITVNRTVYDNVCEDVHETCYRTVMEQCQREVQYQVQRPVYRDLLPRRGIPGPAAPSRKRCTAPAPIRCSGRSARRSTAR